MCAGQAPGGGGSSFRLASLLFLEMSSGLTRVGVEGAGWGQRLALLSVSLSRGGLANWPYRGPRHGKGWTEEGLACSKVVSKCFARQDFCRRQGEAEGTHDLCGEGSQGLGKDGQAAASQGSWGLRGRIRPQMLCQEASLCSGGAGCEE